MRLKWTHELRSVLFPSRPSCASAPCAYVKSWSLYLNLHHAQPWKNLLLLVCMLIFHIMFILKAHLGLCVHTEALFQPPRPPPALRTETSLIDSTCAIIVMLHSWHKVTIMWYLIKSKCNGCSVMLSLHSISNPHMPNCVILQPCWVAWWREIISKKHFPSPTIHPTWSECSSAAGGRERELQTLYEDFVKSCNLNRGKSVECETEIQYCIHLNEFAVSKTTVGANKHILKSPSCHHYVSKVCFCLPRKFLLASSFFFYDAKLHCHRYLNLTMLCIVGYSLEQIA